MPLLVIHHGSILARRLVPRALVNDVLGGGQQGGWLILGFWQDVSQFSGLRDMQRVALFCTDTKLCPGTTPQPGWDPHCIEGLDATKTEQVFLPLPRPLGQLGMPATAVLACTDYPDWPGYRN